MVAARKVSIACAVAIGALAGRAHGQGDARPVFPVEINATPPGSFVRVHGAGTDLPCGERCLLYLIPHDYRVIVRDLEGHESARGLTILRPTSLTVSPGNHRSKMVGIGLFAGGVTAIVAGVGVVYLWKLEHHCQVTDPTCNPANDVVPTWRWYAGGISVAAGLAGGAVGFRIWRANAHAIVGIAPLAEPQQAGLRVTGRF